MRKELLVLAAILSAFFSTAHAADTSLASVKTELALAGISDAAVSVSTPIVVPQAANPFATSDTTLWATLICPSKGAAKLPTILITTAYRHEFMAVLGFSMIKRGYNVLCVDCRGNGSSAGAWAMLDPIEHYDLAYIVDRWIPSQSWSDGKIGMYGPSYMGITQMQTMGLIERDATGTPTHLKAAFPETTMADAYRDGVCPGGNFNFEFGALWVTLTDALALMLPVQVFNLGLLFDDINAPLEIWYEHFEGARAAVGQIVQPGNDRDSSWYDAKSPMIYWADGRDEGLPHGDGSSALPAKLPVFLSAGWFDIFTQGTLKNYMYALKNQAPGDKALIMGEWYHMGASFMPNIASAVNGKLPARWFDWKIKGKDDGFMHEFPVILKVMGDGRWRAEKNWPLPASRVNARSFYLSKLTPSAIAIDWYTHDSRNPRFGLTETPGVNDYAGANPLMTHAATASQLHGRFSRSVIRWSMGATAITPLGDIEDERLDEIGVPTFTTEPLSADLEITGPLTLHFWAKSRFEGPQATLNPQPLLDLINKSYGLEHNMLEDQLKEKTVQWIAEVNDVFPDGRARNITSGWLRASHRPYDPANPTALDPAYRPFDPYYDYPDRNPAAIQEDQLYEYVVEIWPTCNVFRKGHRVRVSLSGSDYPHLLPPLTPSRNEIVIDAEHRAALNFSSVNQNDEGATWKWIGSDSAVSDYLISHRDGPDDVTEASLTARAESSLSQAAAGGNADYSKSSSGGGGGCFISSASLR